MSVLSSGVDLPIVSHGGTASSIVGASTGSRYRSINRIHLEPGGETHTIRHSGEAVYLIAEGEGELRLIGGTVLPVRRRSMTYLPHAVEYRFAARTEMTIFGGPCPPDGQPVGEARQGAQTRVFDAERDGQALPMISQQARLVVWPGVGADVATMNFVVLEPGEENQPHAHPHSDDTIVILEGRGTIDNLESGETCEFSAGDVVHVAAGVRHKVKADRGVRIVSAGGPCPPDRSLLKSIGLID